MREASRRAAMNTEREEQRERHRASNDQFGSTGSGLRERRGLVEEGTAIGLDETGKLMKMHK